MPARVGVVKLVRPCKPFHQPPRPGFRWERLADQCFASVNDHGGKKTYIGLRINFHLRHHIVILHVFLADVAAILDNLDSFPQVICSNRAGLYGSFGNERDRGLRYVCLYKGLSPKTLR